MCVSILVCASLLKFLEGFVFVSGMHALNVKLLKAHWHQCSIEAMSYSLRHRLASLSVAMSGLFLTYKVLFLKYIELFLKYLNLFVKNTLVLESRKCNFMWPLAHHNNFKIANSPLLFLMSWFRENMVTKPLSKNHVCCKRSLGFFGGCRSEPQQFQRSKN